MKFQVIIILLCMHISVFGMESIVLYRRGSDNGYCQKLTQALSKDNQNNISQLFQEKESGAIIIRLLSIDKLNPNMQGKMQGNALLHWSVGENNLGIMELLLMDDRTDRNIKNNAGFTPLGFAVAEGKVFATKLLLKYKANPNIIHQSYIQGSNNHTVLHTALMSYYNHRGYRSKDNYFVIISLLVADESINIDQQDSNGKTPLHYAVWLCDKPVVNLLLNSSHAINMAIKDNNGKTAFDYATDLNQREMRSMLWEYQAESKK